MAGVVQDLRYPVRLLRREPGYAATAVLAIALAIGATTTLFSVTYGVLLKPLPWPQPDQLVRLEERRGGRPGRLPLTITNGTYLAWRDGSSTTVETIGGWMSAPASFGDGGEPERIRIGRLTPSVFAVLGTPPLAGRVFSEQDVADSQCEHGDTFAWLLAASLRRRSRRPWPLDTSGPRHLHRGRDHADPLRLSGLRNRRVAARLHRTSLQRRWRRGLAAESSGRSLACGPAFGAEQVAAEGTARARGGRDPGTVALAVFGSGEPPTISAKPALDVLIDDVRPAIRVQLAAVLLLFVTAIASVATLQLARAVKRRREMTVRVAIGAGTARLARQWLIESAVVGIAGAWLGWVGRCCCCPRFQRSFRPTSRASTRSRSTGAWRSPRLWQRWWRFWYAGCCRQSRVVVSTSCARSRTTALARSAARGAPASRAFVPPSWSDRLPWRACS